MSRKIFLSLVVVMVVVGAIIGLYKASHEDGITSDNTITLGFMLPLTGQFGVVSEGIKNAGEMAVEDYKIAHPEVEIQVVVEDDGFDVKKGIPAYTKLTTINKVNGIMMVSTPIIDAHYESMKKDGLPVVSIGLQNYGVATDNIFQTTLAPIAPIEYMATFVETKSHTKTAVVYTNVLPATKSFYDTFIKNYSKQHVDFVVTDSESAKVVATKIMTGGFDSVVILEDAIGGPLVTKEIKVLDTNNSLTFYYDLQLTTGWAEYEKILGDTTLLNNAYALKIKGGDLTMFVEKYKAKYGVEPTPFAEYGYDSAMLLLNGYDTDQETWITNIQNADFTGPSGKMSFDENGVRLQEIEMVTVENGSVQ